MHYHIYIYTLACSACTWMMIPLREYQATVTCSWLYAQTYLHTTYVHIVHALVMRILVCSPAQWDQSGQFSQFSDMQTLGHHSWTSASCTTMSGALFVWLQIRSFAKINLGWGHLHEPTAAFMATLINQPSVGMDQYNTCQISGTRHKWTWMNMSSSQ